MSHPEHVPDDVVAAFRAYLSGDRELWKTRNEALDRSRTVQRAYRAFVSAMFAEAVDRRLGRHPAWERIVEFVADIRARDDALADALDPDETERMIAWVDDDAGIDDIDADRSLGIWILVVTVIVRDADLDDAGLDAFLQRARTFADEVLG